MSRPQGVYTSRACVSGSRQTGQSGFAAAICTSAQRLQQAGGCRTAVELHAYLVSQLWRHARYVDDWPSVMRQAVAMSTAHKAVQRMWHVQAKDGALTGRGTGDRKAPARSHACPPSRLRSRAAGRRCGLQVLIGPLHTRKPSQQP